MKRIVLAVLAVLALALVASCKPKECPACPPPQPAPTCPEAKCDIALENASTTPAWYLVEQDGKVMLTATMPDKRVIAVPIEPTTQVFVDGKAGTGDSVLRLGCPCRLDQCMPYCRPIGDVLSPTPQPAPPQ
jgi:hypothetical protein